jgi:hypothetical protein
LDEIAGSHEQDAPSVLDETSASPTAAATDTTDYVATDTNSLTSTSTRTVIVSRKRRGKEVGRLVIRSIR